VFSLGEVEASPRLTLVHDHNYFCPGVNGTYGINAGAPKDVYVSESFSLPLHL
jgi:hypothetical protein